MKKLLFIALIAFSTHAFAQIIMPTQTFDTDVLMHGTTGSVTAWFAPSSNTAISWVSSGGNPGGNIGYSGSWNNFWGNFVRLPQANCSTWDTVMLSFDISHSYFASQPNDWIRFYIWDQGSGSYKNPVSHIKINGVESMVNFGANGYGFRFNVARNWAHVEVFFNMSVITNLTNVLFYIEPSCYYNNSNTFFVNFDNIQLTGIETNYVGLPQTEVAETAIQVFPTFFQNEITLRTNSPDRTSEIKLINAAGQVVFSDNMPLNRGDNTISLPRIAVGVYYLFVKSASGNTCQKIFRQ